jgi:hypothetical protein
MFIGCWWSLGGLEVRSVQEKDKRPNANGESHILSVARAIVDDLANLYYTDGIGSDNCCGRNYSPGMDSF